MADRSRPSDLYPGGRWTAIPHQVMEDQELTGIDKLVYNAIASWMSLKTAISYREITFRSGVTDPRTIRACIAVLAKAGYLVVEKRNGSPHRFMLIPIPEPDRSDPQPSASDVPGTSHALGTSDVGGPSASDPRDPVHPMPPHKRAIDQSSSSGSSSETTSPSQPTPEQLSAGYRVVDKKIHDGIAVINRDSLAYKIAIDDFDEDGNPTTGPAGPATYSSKPPEPAIDPAVEACQRCDHRGLRLEDWATPDDPVPIVPPIHCDHLVAS